jgi:transcription termination/antitermination protein NusA
MNPSELLRLVDSLHREKDIDSESVFKGIESALLSAARKHLGASDNLVVTIDRQTGEVRATDGDREIDPSDLGRIAAQTAKQVMIQKIREAERDAISHDFTDRVHTVVTGTVQRFEGPNIVVNLAKTEGFLPRSEQIFSETYHVGERLRALVLEVRAVGTRVRVVLSRSHPEFVRRLFELEVPEVGEGLVEIKAIAREAGYRTKIAVNSLDPRVDSVGACVGVQGSRIKSIVDELNGEKIDIVRWSDQMDALIANTLKPAEIESIDLNAERRHALVIVPEDQLSLAIGKRGQNVRLAAKLSGWDIDIKPSVTSKPEAPAAPPEAKPPEAAEEPKVEAAAVPEAVEEPKVEIAAMPEAAEPAPAPVSEAPGEPSNAAPDAPRSEPQSGTAD